MVFFKLWCCERVCKSAGRAQFITYAGHTQRHIMETLIVWTRLDRRLLCKRLLQTCKIERNVYINPFFHPNCWKKRNCLFSVSNTSVTRAYKAVVTFRKARRKSKIAQIGNEYSYGHLYMRVTRESSWNPIPIALERDRPPPVLSPNRIVPPPSSPLRLHSRKEKFGPRYRNISIFYFFFILRKSETASASECL